MLGWSEILLVLLLVLLLFGGKKLPDLAKNLGEGIREFRKASQDLSKEITTPPPTDKKQQESDEKN